MFYRKNKPASFFQTTKCFLANSRKIFNIMKRQRADYHIKALGFILVVFNWHSAIINLRKVPHLSCLLQHFGKISIPSTYSAPYSAAYRQCQPNPQPKSKTFSPQNIASVFVIRATHQPLWLCFSKKSLSSYLFSCTGSLLHKSCRQCLQLFTLIPTFLFFVGSNIHIILLFHCKND